MIRAATLPYRAARSLVRSVHSSIRRRIHIARHNRQYTRHDQRILILHEAVRGSKFLDVVLNWLTQHHPRVRAHFDLRLRPCAVRDWSRYVLFVPWLQDPVQQWSRLTFRRVRQLEKACSDHGIAVINSVNHLINATKYEGARRMREAGLCVPRVAHIENRQRYRDDFCGVDPPFIIREDWGHGGAMVKVDTAEQARTVDLSRFKRPIVVEFIDASNPVDGIFRKYRYVAAGDTGIALSVHASSNWITRGSRSIATPEILAEETAFTNQMDANHAAFQCARNALELDYVAFDYGYDRQGQMVVWEANPFPLLHLPRTSSHPARRDGYIRVFQALVRLYLLRAGLPVPEDIDEALEAYRQGEHARS